MENDKPIEGQIDIEEQQGVKLDDLLELKNNMAELREKNERLKQENARLADYVLNNNAPQEPEPEQEVDIESLRKELFSQDNDMSNLEYVESALKLREAIIANGGDDPFLPIGNNIQPTNEDREAAERVATVFKECIEQSNGDSDIFTATLMSRTKEPLMPSRKR